MIKIFRYELRRLLTGKLFVGILLICLGYGYLTLTGVTIQGVANTAPFSPWSFGAYLSQLLPLICLAELSFIAFFHSARQRRLLPITQAAPADARRYAAVRCGAVLTATLLLCLCVAALALGFYGTLFGADCLHGLLRPAVTGLFPALLFCLGAGWALSRLRPAAVYLLMAAVCLLVWLPLPWTAAFSMDRFFCEYPLRLKVLDPVFSLPSDVRAGRLLWSAAGLLLLGWSQLAPYKLRMPSRDSAR